MQDFCSYDLERSFRSYDDKLKASSLISTLLASLNENEYLITYNNQTTLFEYGKFIKIIHHGHFVKNITNWIELSKKKKKIEIGETLNIMFHLIMQQSNLQELIFGRDYLPEFSIFTTYKAQITNLRSLSIKIDPRNKDTIKLLSILNMVSMLNIFRLQLSWSMFEEDAKEITSALGALKLQLKTLKVLTFVYWNFKWIDISFISELEHLEQLEFEFCLGFVSQYSEALLFKRKKFHLKKLKFL